ncbi:LamG domain-containing protein [Kribbella capetownensis]|uniref:LamG domain-containing protein n=1 Tax=Kribbella capetownensis TaxID=1572659 RepID=A0A4R0JG73_9ACTN|nr:LamG-like jellyroll fold domain-containing protein [Kribbella capetownensis]TCC44624.1 LamG domain-containing protein [Kribbella capetownensis]
MTPAEAHPAAVNAAAADSPAKRAKATGKRVEVPEKRTETEQTFANPDGTFTLEQTNIPARVKRGNEWVDIDTTLERSADGRVRPKATALDMTFSGGGTGPLIVMNAGNRKLALGWPGPLPAPVVAGDNVTYPGVFPDVDLKITALADSYTEVLVVKTPVAARLPQLQALDLKIDAPGLTVAKAPGGVIEAKDNLGKVVFSGAQPVMWDSRGRAAAPTDDDRSEAPLEGDKVAQLPVKVTRNSLTMSPAPALVNDAATKYPLHIDPTFNAGQSGRAMMNEHYPTTASWNWAGPEGVGYQSFEPWSRKRLIYKMGLSGLAGTHILTAKFSAKETWAASCDKKEVQAWKVAAINTEVDWSNGSGSNVWLKKLASVTDAVGRDECTPGGKLLEFDVLTAVAEQAAARSAWVHLGLRAASETDSMAWKRFDKVVTLVITFNRLPVVSAMRTTDPTMGCSTDYQNPARVNQTSPVPHVKILDGDQLPASAGFEFWYNGQQAATQRLTSVTKVATSTVDFTPQGDVAPLLPNKLIGWRVRAWDGVDYSAWSPMCWFTIDTSKPAPPEVTILSGDDKIYSLGEQISVKIGATAVDQNYFRYTIDTEEPTSPNIPVSPGTFTFTATRTGPTVIRAWAYDRVGNRSVDYGEAVVKVKTGDPVGIWRMDEGSGITTADSSGHGRRLNLATTATWAQGDRWDPSVPNQDWSVGLTGGATMGSPASDIVDTSRSFSASVRVKLGNTPGRQIALSEDRAGTSGFTLGVLSQNLSDPGDPKAVWSFSIANPKGSGDISVVSPPTSYLAGDWVYLTGVYDSGEHTLTLFVGEEAVAAKSDVAPTADAPGLLRVGTGMVAGVASPIDGQADDVRMYAGPIDDAAVYKDLYDSAPTN